MKKIYLLILITALVISLVGCGDNKAGTEGEENNPFEDENGEEPTESPDQEDEGPAEEIEESEKLEDEDEIDLDKYYNMGKTLYDLGLFSGVSANEYAPNLE